MKKIEHILKDPLYQDYLVKNAVYEVERRFCRHDFQHMLDVSRITYILFLEAGELGLLAKTFGLPEPEAAKELIYAAGLVHDIARWRQYETGEDHAKAGVELAYPLLSRAGFATGEVEAIVAAVREHRTGAEKSSLLGERLCRADDLSRPCFHCKAQEDCHKFSKINSTRNGVLIY